MVEVSSYMLDSGVFSDNLLRPSGSNYREAILIRLEKPLIKGTLWIARRSTEMHSSVITGSQRLMQDPIKRTEQCSPGLNMTLILLFELAGIRES